jgi:type IV secretory pathway component VirB8
MLEEGLLSKGRINEDKVEERVIKLEKFNNIVVLSAFFIFIGMVLQITTYMLMLDAQYKVMNKIMILREEIRENK